METVLGAGVILVAVLFVMFGYKTANVGKGSGGYEIAADFTGVGGLKPGDEVQISGVKVGSVTAIDIMPDTYSGKNTRWMSRLMRRKLKEDGLELREMFASKKKNKA